MKIDSILCCAKLRQHVKILSYFPMLAKLPRVCVVESRLTRSRPSLWWLSYIPLVVRL